MYNFSELLKKIRNEGNLTQEELASVLGVSTVLVSMIETEQKEVSKSFIIKLASKLEVNPSSITPFLLIQSNISNNKLSNPEKSLVAVGERLQDYLIKTKSKNLRQYA